MYYIIIRITTLNNNYFYYSLNSVLKSATVKLAAGYNNIPTYLVEVLSRRYYIWMLRYYDREADF